ncbi:hypothetical protein GBAR_LOCUS3514 [Geodia barretti]|uniref:Uncharacterized protein n=1 Tax=Geodia barretti TaxID=519541 RepID=A0AA35R4M4_GEOBA|nr:hypothetical protein GBAR_LOCUS3514 [Geodia barretti]
MFTRDSSKVICEESQLKREVVMRCTKHCRQSG